MQVLGCEVFCCEVEQMSQALYINLKKDKAQVFISVLCKVQQILRAQM